MALLMPFIGRFVDNYGHRMTLSFLNNFLIFLTHYMLMTLPDCNRCSISLVPFLLSGLIQSLLFVNIWGIVPLLVPQSSIGRAYGLLFATSNIGTSFLPYLQSYLIDSTKMLIMAIIIWSYLSFYGACSRQSLKFSFISGT
jgi:MFS-type transporter involved in bile tolerance (Atg22 family)